MARPRARKEKNAKALKARPLPLVKKKKSMATNLPVARPLINKEKKSMATTLPVARLLIKKNEESMATTLPVARPLFNEEKSMATTLPVARPLINMEKQSMATTMPVARPLFKKEEKSMATKLPVIGSRLCVGEKNRSKYEKEVLGSAVQIQFIVDEYGRAMFFEGVISQLRMELDINNGSLQVEHFVQFLDGDHRWFDLASEEAQGRLKWPEVSEAKKAPHPTQVIKTVSSTTTMSESRCAGL